MSYAHLSLEERHYIEVEMKMGVSLNKIAEKLISFAKMLYENFGLITFIWEPVATMTFSCNNFNDAYPTVGSEQERNYATRLVSTELRKKSNELLKLGFQVYSFGICKKLSPGYLTDHSLYIDGVHLNRRGLGLGILSFKKLCKSLNRKFISFFGSILGGRILGKNMGSFPLTKDTNPVDFFVIIGIFLGIE